MPNFFLANWWPGVLLWATLYILDFTMTMVCARLYQKGAREKISFEGSYEITPFYQKDVDRLRTVSPRFIAVLVLYGILIAMVWAVSMASVPEIYVFLLGAVVGIQFAVHVRHLRNLVLFRNLAGNDGVKGRIEYSRPVMLRMSAVEIAAFGLMFAALAGLTQSWFLAGAALSCFSVASKHNSYARKHAITVEKVQVANAG